MADSHRVRGVGLVLAALLTAAFALPAAPPAWSAPVPQAVTLQVGALAQVANTGGEAVNVRERPGLTSNVLGSLAEGTVVLVDAGPETADGMRWWRVTSTQLAAGWMGETWLTAVASPQVVASVAAAAGATVPARPTATPAAAATAQTMTLPAPIVTVAPVGMGPAAQATPAAPTTATTAVTRGGTLRIGGQAVVTVGSGDAANIRATASTSAALAGTAPDGAIVTIVDGPVSAEGYRWWLVNWSGAIGFIVEGFLAPIQ